MKSNNYEVGKRIKNIRLQLGKTTADFGYLVGKASGSLVSRWERGVNLPNNERLKRIAEIGDMSVADLLFGEESIDNRLKDAIKTHIEDFPFSESEREFLNKIKDDITPLLIQRIREYGKDIALIYLILYLEDRLENIADVHSSSFSMSVFDISFDELNLPKIKDDLIYFYKNINSLDENDLSKVFKTNTSTNNNTIIDNEHLYKSMLKLYKQNHSIEVITDFYVGNLMDSPNGFTKEDVQFLVSKALENSI